VNRKKNFFLFPNRSEVTRISENMKEKSREIAVREVKPRGKFDRIGTEIQGTFAGELTRFFGFYFQRNYDILPSSFWETTGGDAGASLTHARRKGALYRTLYARVSQ